LDIEWNILYLYIIGWKLNLDIELGRNLDIGWKLNLDNEWKFVFDIVWLARKGC
jgi:hypothetical protein